MPLVRSGQAAPPATVAGPGLVAALTGGAVDDRWAAARALGELDEHIDVLAEALEKESEPRVREAIFTSLARAGTPRSIDAILPWLKSEDADRRTGALDALRSLPQIAAPVVARLIADQIGRASCRERV